MIPNPEIIYEDENVVAVNKPAGLLVHETRNMKHETDATQHRTRNMNHEMSDVSRSMFHVSENPTLVDWLLKKYPEIKNVGDPSTSLGQVNLRPGIVHRLDKDTSGVMLVAKNQESFLYMKSLFAGH